jgi:hypothetical protein
VFASLTSPIRVTCPTRNDYPKVVSSSHLLVQGVLETQVMKSFWRTN